MVKKLIFSVNEIRFPWNRVKRCRNNIPSLLLIEEKGEIGYSFFFCEKHFFKKAIMVLVIKRAIMLLSICVYTVCEEE